MGRCASQELGRNSKLPATQGGHHTVKWVNLPRRHAFDHVVVGSAHHPGCGMLAASKSGHSLPPGGPLAIMLIAPAIFMPVLETAAACGGRW